MRNSTTGGRRHGRAVKRDTAAVVLSRPQQVSIAIAVLVMCGAIGAVFGSSEYAAHGASWMWSRVAGRDSLGELLGGHVGLVLTLILSIAAITGWLWLLTQVMHLAFRYAGWSR